MEIENLVEDALATVVSRKRGKKARPRTARADFSRARRQELDKHTLWIRKATADYKRVHSGPPGGICFRFE